MKLVKIIMLALCLSLFSMTLEIKTPVRCKHPLLNKILIQMRKEKKIKDPKIQEIFCKVDRNNFLRKKQNYGMEAIYIGHGATLSMADGHMNALEQAYEKFKDTKKPLKILDIGSGSGIM